MAATHVNPHAMALLGETILCTRCGRTQQQIADAEESRRLCNAPMAPARASQGVQQQSNGDSNNNGAPASAGAAVASSLPSLSYTPSPAIFEQYGDFTLEAKVENFPAASPPQVFSVNPRLPTGVTIDTSTGTISGSAIGSGGARHEHTASFTITARDASSKVSASFQLILSFVDKQLRPNLGTCVACMEVVQETVERRAACCPTKTDERPEGRHVYCHDCFQALVRAEMSALPLVCRACGDNPQPQQEQAQDQAQAQAAAAAPAPPAPAFEDSEIMRALGDKARVRYCELVKEALPPFHVRVKCAARGCNWEARIPEKKVDDLILCERKNCARLTCRDCETVVEFKGQGQWAGQHIDAAATNRYNDIVVDEHLIVCALRKRIEDVCTFGLCVRCPTCGTRTQKNEACSHMICRNPKCGTRYCYCCGLARIDCDGAGANNWGVHNSNWTRNPLRCPMYLEQIHSVDPTWPATPEGALAQLHKEQVLRHLQRLLKHADPGVYEAILTARYGAYTRDAVTSFAERPFFRNRRMPPL